jgi:uncharacterized protein YdbL (DUF1318 family)
MDRLKLFGVVLALTCVGCGPSGDVEAQKQMARVKGQVTEMATSIFALKSEGVAVEGPRGFLATNAEGGDVADLGQREMIQRENFAREQIFADIATRKGLATEDVGRQFARLARGGGVGPTP